MLTVVTRTTPSCVYCSAAKSFLKRKKVDYVEVDLNDVLDQIRELGIKTVPAIFNGEVSKENFIGGYDQIKQHLSGL